MVLNHSSAPLQTFAALKEITSLEKSLLLSSVTLQKATNPVFRLISLEEIPTCKSAMLKMDFWITENQSNNSGWRADIIWKK
jgi:hypothetical protein